LRKHLFIIIRYSMLERKQVSWQIARDVDFEEYKRNLFNPIRLSKREKLFSEITLPSLVSLNPDPDHITALVFTSDELPAEYMNRLQQLLQPYRWAKVIPTSADQHIRNAVAPIIMNELKKHDEPVCFGTTRLDDDDALAHYFTDVMNQYLSPNFKGFCVSFSRGYAGIYEESFTSFHAQETPKIALGLSFINTYDPTKSTLDEPITVFSLGNHRKIDSVCPVILDARNPMFLRTMHFSSDSTTEDKVKKIKTTPEIDSSEIIKAFPAIRI